MIAMLVLAGAFGTIIAVGALAVLVNDAIEARLRSDARPAGGGGRSRPAPRSHSLPAAGRTAPTYVTLTDRSRRQTPAGATRRGRVRSASRFGTR